jgi:hypothetical protein
MRQILNFFGNTLRWLALGLVLLIVSTPLWVSFYLDARGVAADGQITDKRETLVARRDSWRRQFYLTFQYQPQDNLIPETASVEVDQATYDQLHVGSSVRVRYLSVRPLRELSIFFTPARLEGQTTFTALGNWWESVAANFKSVPADSFVQAKATVERVVLIDTEARRSTKLLQPMQRVEFKYTVPGLDEPVQAADVIDAGSVRSLEVGGRAAIVYSKDDPRTASLVGGTYRYRWINPLGTVGGLALVAVFCGIPWLIGSVFYNRFKARVRARLDAARLNPSR